MPPDLVRGGSREASGWHCHMAKATTRPTAGVLLPPTQWGRCVTSSDSMSRGDGRQELGRCFCSRREFLRCLSAQRQRSWRQSRLI